MALPRIFQRFARRKNDDSWHGSTEDYGLIASFQKMSSEDRRNIACILVPFIALPVTFFTAGTILRATHGQPQSGTVVCSATGSSKRVTDFSSLNGIYTDPDIQMRVDIGNNPGCNFVPDTLDPE
jgi:hypothetical protein